MKTVLVAINSKYIHTALGMRYISEFCKNENLDIELIEETIQTPVLAVLARITKIKADNIALSVHIWNKSYVYNLIDLLRKVLPNIKIIIGGPEVAFDPERVFCELPEVNYIVQGEGEECVARLLVAMDKGEEIVPQHIAYQDSNGKVNLNGGVTVIEDLSMLPFPYPDINEVVTNSKIAYYECTRGCPFQCSYCLSGISRNVRRRELSKVLSDMDKFIAAKIPLVKFVDRTYNLDENYFVPIMRYLAEAETETTFHFEIKADLLSENTLKFLKTVPEGRFQFEIGVQSTNEATLEAIGRQDNWSALSKNVKTLLSYNNIHLHLDLIAGLPFEGLEEFAKSFNDVYSLKPQMLQLGFLKVLKGTKMESQTAEHGLLYMNEPPYEIVQTKYIGYEDLRLLKVLEDVFDKTYNSGKFANTLKCLIELSGKEPFEFYLEITKWWESKGLYPLGHNSRGVTSLLWQFVNEHYSQNANFVKEVLRFDVFCSQPNWCPEWLEWNMKTINDANVEFWRDIEEVKEYLPRYEFTTWREIKKKYPVEMFYFDEKIQEKGNSIFMADYTRNNNVTYLLKSKYFSDVKK